MNTKTISIVGNAGFRGQQGDSRCDGVGLAWEEGQEGYEVLKLLPFEEISPQERHWDELKSYLVSLREWDRTIRYRKENKDKSVDYYDAETNQ